jgi:hypothetical protein
MATLSAPNFIEGHQSFQLTYGLGFQPVLSSNGGQFILIL